MASASSRKHQMMDDAVGGPGGPGEAQALERGARAAASSKTHSCLTADLWKEMVFPKSPYQEFTDHLVRTHTSLHERTQAPAVATINFI